MAANPLLPPPPLPQLYTRHQPNNLTGRGAHLAIISILFTTVAVSLVCSRLATRWAVRQSLGGCDVTICVSVVVAIGMTVSNCVAIVHGLGKEESMLELGDLRVALKAFWATQILYTLTTMLTKTSIVFMYMRIFPNPKFHRIAWIVVAYVNLCGIAGIGSTVDECTPRERIWDKQVAGTCIDLTVFWYIYASANMLGDFAILALPVPAVRGLNLPQRQKMGILLVFALGGFVCITSILRMTTLKRGAQATDVTYGTLDFVIWSTIEANMAIICACLPMLKAPLARLFPRLFPRGSTRSEMTCPSIAAFCRPGQSSGSPNASSHSYDNWGRLKSNRQMDMDLERRDGILGLFDPRISPLISLSRTSHPPFARYMKSPTGFPTKNNRSASPQAQQQQQPYPPSPNTPPTHPSQATKSSAVTAAPTTSPQQRPPAISIANQGNKTSSIITAVTTPSKPQKAGKGKSLAIVGSLSRNLILRNHDRLIPTPVAVVARKRS